MADGVRVYRPGMVVRGWGVKVSSWLSLSQNTPPFKVPASSPPTLREKERRTASRKGGGGITFGEVVSLECGDLAQGHVGERSNGDLMSLSSQVSNTLSCVADIIHRYAPVEPSIHVVRMVHIPCTCPHWAWGFITAVTVTQQYHNHHRRQSIGHIHKLTSQHLNCCAYL